MYFTYLLPTILLGAHTIHANVIAERAVENGPCTGSGGAPGVCIATAECSSGGGIYISGACPGTPTDIKCCTKTSCGSGGNCRWVSQCSTSTVSGLCPGPADFKCCVPAGSSGPYPPPAIPPVGACKAPAVNGAQKVVNGNPGKVREIYCTRACSCPGTSDHCCGMAIDFMCSSAGGVSAPCWSTFWYCVGINVTDCALKVRTTIGEPIGARRSGTLLKMPSSPGRNGGVWRTEARSLRITGSFFALSLISR